MTVGYRVKKLREARHMMQSELAEEIGVSTSSIAKWERGDREICQEELIKLSKLFNVSTDYILGLTYPEIDIAFYNQLGELTDEQKKEVVNFATYVRSKNV